MKAGKGVGLDGCCIDCLKSVCTSVLDWLIRLLNVCFITSLAPVDWTSVCVVSLYKDEGDKYECVSFMGISVLSVVGKV